MEERFRLGIEEIDEQHDKLISIALGLKDDLAKGKPIDSKKFLQDLSQFAEEHFSTEEEYFKKIQYDLEKFHVAEHDNMRNRISQLIEKEKAGSAVTTEVVNFILSWLDYHLKNFDMTYKEKVKKVIISEN